MSEVWVRSQIAPPFEISNLGRVRSPERIVEVKGGERKGHFRKVPMRVLVLTTAKGTGYKVINLARNGSFLVHRLVAYEFCPGFSSGLTVNHKNGVRDDNKASNLEWVTYQQNTKHSFDHLGRKATFLGVYGRNHPASKPVISRCLITGEEKTYDSAREATKEGFLDSNISRCCNGKNKSHKGRSWRYEGEST